jgi:hypothetical protein
MYEDVYAMPELLARCTTWADLPILRLAAGSASE